MKGKEKCKALKELRQKIAEVNDIEYAVSECKHQGDCKGTCPKCEAELRYLERELERRTNLGKKVVLAGLSVCMAGVVSGCDDNEEKNPWSGWNSGIPTTTEERLEGDVEYVEPDTTKTESATTEMELEGDTEYVEPDTTETESATTEMELEGDVEYVEPSTTTEEASEDDTLEIDGDIIYYDEANTTEDDTSSE